MSSRHPLRRAGLILAVPALTVSGLALTVAPASAAPDPSSAQVQGGARWLRTQLTGGIVHNNDFDFDDIGLSADFAFGLDSVGEAGTATTITNAIEPRAAGEWYTSSFGGVTTTYAGSLAKALVLAQTTGSDPTDFGGENLVTGLEGLVAADAPITGRIEDVNNAFGDANVIGQAYAAQGLTAAGSGQADEVTDFLLQQQCAAGFFRLNFNPDKAEADQTCDGGSTEENPPDPDATSLVVLALQAQSADPDVAAALDLAVTWLLSVQQSDGSFIGGTSTNVKNSNSTGLAGQALGASGEDAAATAAADWVGDLQSARLGKCSQSGLADEIGAVAYNQAAYDDAHAGGIAAADEDQWRRATAQAVPVLQWMTDPQAVGDATLSVPGGFVRGGSDAATITVTGLAAGERACVQGNGVAEVVKGGTTSRVDFKAPLGTGTYTYRLVRLGDQPTDTMTVLGSLKVPFSLKRSVAKGNQQVVRVKGLEAGERVKVKFGKDVVDTGEANAHGKFTSRFKVTGPKGEADVKVQGQFPTRSATKTFTVTR